MGSLALSLTRISTHPIASRPIDMTVTVTNNGGSSVALNSLVVRDAGKSGSVIAQPRFQVLNAPTTSDKPVIDAAGSVTYPFQVVPNSPRFGGPSPQNPGGAVPFAGANPAPNSLLYLIAESLDADGVVATSILFIVPVLHTITPLPRDEGGGLDFRQGSNFMTLALMGAL